MGEPNRVERVDDELTTADLAGRTTESDRTMERDVEDPARPKLVKSAASDIRPRDAAQDFVPVATNASTAQTVGRSAPLFTESDVTDLRSRWSNVQTGFVDEPRHAVEEADKLVAAVMKRLAEGFANERSSLEKQWGQGDNVSTEDLRLALQHYRSFFERLLNT